MPVPLSGYLDLAFDFLPVGVGIARRPNRKGGAALFLWFVVLGLVVELVTFVIGRMRINNLWILHIYALLEYVILIILFAGWQKEAGRLFLQRLLYVSIGV